MKGLYIVVVLVVVCRFSLGVENEVSALRNGNFGENSSNGRADRLHGTAHQSLENLQMQRKFK